MTCTVTGVLTLQTHDDSAIHFGRVAELLNSGNLQINCQRL
jgi:hypothetical protein